ncbi:hypothetical protein KO465_04670 [Candidatus Micrarchaeota archaeon]|nr:hypothetical protein [Candidatus Micrarchaeota archaeon]
MLKTTEDKARLILKEVQDRLKSAESKDGENREAALDDLKFIAVEQWPDHIRQQREADQRPCLTVNKMPTYLDQVVGDQRMNRPQLLVLPVDNNADIKTAKVLNGWIKHIWRISKADSIIDNGFEHAAACGYGAVRVVTRYIDEMSFDQEAYIVPVENALAIYWGDHVEYDCSDSDYCIIIADMNREEFKRTYKKEPMPFNSTDSRFVDGWCTKDKVRIAEYFVKEKEPFTLYELIDGTITDSLPPNTPESSIKNKRDSEKITIKWYLVSGNDVLDETEWIGKKYIPVVPIWGKELNVGGRKYLRGLIRNGKDSQRMYNYWNSVDTETIALQPKMPYMVTAKQIAGHEAQWRQIHQQNFPYVLVNPDPKAPGWPKREAPPQISSAFATKIAQTDQDIKDTIGLQKASLGMESNERSGVAIRERKHEGDVGVYAFYDNLSRSIEQIGRVLLDVAPSLLDTQKKIRLGLDDGTVAFKEVNIPRTDEEGNQYTEIDVTTGVYDVAVSAGPSFTTQRSEMRRSMTEFIQYAPGIAPLILDLFAKAQDWEGAEEIAKRAEFLLPPEIREELAAQRVEAPEGQDRLPPASSPPDETNLGRLPENSSAEASEQPSQEEQELTQEQVELEILMVKLEQEKAKLDGIRLKNKQLEAETGITAAEVSTEEKVEQPNAEEGMVMPSVIEESVAPMPEIPVSEIPIPEMEVEIPEEEAAMLELPENLAP